MHSKTKGGLGVSKAVSWFIQNQIPVFVEAFCDLSEIDLVILHGTELKSVQVRTTTTKNGSAKLSLRSITPGTRNKPCVAKRISNDIDLFVLYVLDKDRLLFIPANKIKQFKNSVSFRFSEKKNGNQNEVFRAKDFYKVDTHQEKI